MTDDVYFTMKEIGASLGLTSHQIGRRLKDLGLREDNGKPSKLAFDCGMVAQKWTADRTKYLWAWHQGQTLKALAAVGVQPRTEPSSASPN